MELQHVLSRYAEGLSALDEHMDSGRANPRTGEIYLPGVKSQLEATMVDALDEWWANHYPNELFGLAKSRVGIPYPNLARTKCDHVINTDRGEEPEWAIEVKNIALVGNNGKRNDFAVSKILSPFLKDRSLLHDVVRLRTYSLARRHAVIGYSFGYSFETCEKALGLHPNRVSEIENIREVCRTNGGELSIEPLLEFADGIMRVRGLITGAMAVEKFEGWRHPCGGRGLVFGWEVRRPELNSNFDPRHPW
jgi:hypothetical protein